MTPLRQRMIEEMKIRNLAVSTQTSYLLHVSQFARNIQLANVLSDITGKSGQAILHAILEGERDPHELAALRTQPGRQLARRSVVSAPAGTSRLRVLSEADGGM